MLHKPFELPPPQAFNMPERYTEWRPFQDLAILEIVDTDKRFITQVCPTGFGKSLTYVAAATLQRGRGIILTSTKGLQSQLIFDFKSMGAVDIRGRNAYPCLLLNDGSRCDTGPCNAGIRCKLRDSGCSYFDKVKEALKAPLVISNYAYWMTSNAYGDGLGKFNFMVCDEAHDTPDTVSSFLTVKLSRTDPLIKPILPSNNEIYQMTMPMWKAWAWDRGKGVGVEVDALVDYIKGGGGDQNDRWKLSRLRSLLQDLETLAKADEDDWVLDVDKFSATFCPIWPKAYCEKYLFQDIEKVLLTSASVRAKTMEYLGIAGEELIMSEYPHMFPVDRRLLIHIPTIRLNFRTTPEEMRVWQRRVDQIIRPRLDRKGIMHTGSYIRRDLILNNSKFKSSMITHQRADTERRVLEFKDSMPPSTLVSPSVTTGFDFPYDECRYQIIGKLCYPDTRNKITAARAKDDRDYAPYIAMQQLVQACGRGCRAADDLCENFIIDDNIGWFMERYSSFAPDWFNEAFVAKGAIPPPATLYKGEYHDDNM
ncbi:hypothetical protein LCGC14_0614000 [marine sediment metagenome]|uniref:ATP-dependent helicase C-terminal domain-containing protein n=1 Tax=marine sediment metagenome TaxID=412755 RepID=A0A0F9R710_9ZZZZ